MKRMPSLYIAHAISQPLAAGRDTWQMHYYNVCEFASAIAELRILPTVPVLLPSISHTQALNIDRQFVEDVDGIAIFMDRLGWWKESTGVTREAMWCKRFGKPVLHGTETNMDSIKKWLRAWKIHEANTRKSK